MNAPSSTRFTPLPIITDVRASQKAKAKPFMAVTPSGIVIEVSDVHPSKADSPMRVTLLGIAIEAMCFLPRNAFGDIAVIPSGIMVVLLPASKVFVLVMMMALQLLRLSYVGLPSSTTIVESGQRENARSPIEVTLFGMTIEVKEQDSKVYVPILVTVFGIVISLSEEQPQKAWSIFVTP